MSFDNFREVPGFILGSEVCIKVSLVPGLILGSLSRLILGSKRKNFDVSFDNFREVPRLILGSEACIKVSPVPGFILGSKREPEMTMEKRRKLEMEREKRIRRITETLSQLETDEEKICLPEDEETIKSMRGNIEKAIQEKIWHQQNKIIYNVIDRIKTEKEWRDFTKNKLAMNDIIQKQMLETSGEIGVESKVQMLKHWKKTRAQYGNSTDVLIKLTEDFLQMKFKESLKRNNFDFVSRLVARAIENEKWQRFVLVKLELRNDEVMMLRGKYSSFSEEQKYQLLLDFIRTVTEMEVQTDRVENPVRALTESGDYGTEHI